MFEQILYFFLAIFGFGLLVFIHEFGHFWMARREGMKVEAFSIGFGRPIYSWIKNGVRWQIGWLPFGGYVRIAGMQREGSREPHEITDGFYNKRPSQRIRVAMMGPLVNILFALLAFALIFLSGGREKEFSDITHRIGWVDPKSPLYQKGVRPGDVIQTYDGRPFDGIKDLFIAAITKDDVNRIEGYKIDYLSGKRSNFDYTLKTYENPIVSKEHLLTIGVMTPARYFIYDDAFKIPNGSPMFSSGIQPHDQLIWADGEMIFSFEQLRTLINDSTAFLTVQRGDTVFQTKVPRVHIDELKMNAIQKAELDDWQHEALLTGKLQDLYFIPYLLSPSGDVEMRLGFIDPSDQQAAFSICQRCPYFHPLEEGDHILAIDGRAVSSSYDLLRSLQERHVLLIVRRDPSAIKKVSWKEADAHFEKYLQIDDLKMIVSSFGMSDSIRESNHLVLLNPVIPKLAKDVPLPPEMAALQKAHLAEIKKEIDAIQDPGIRAEKQKKFEADQETVALGLIFLDRKVIYNPGPAQQFMEVLDDTWRALSGMISGAVNPKYASGPIGIVQVMHKSWEAGIKEALYWLAVISLNLGILNLLPIPVLDGGHICFSIYEGVTKRRLSGKTMERLIIPFIVLIVAFFLFVTFQDVLRLFSKFF